jgi:hypothetical protein
VREDPLVRRLGRTAVIVCVATIAGALVLFGARAAAAVAAGGALIGVSFAALAGGTGALAQLLSGQANAADRTRIVRGAMIRLIGRYALLGLLAYVMIARLRLHPLGLLAGVSSVVVAAFIEAARLLTKKT